MRPLPPMFESHAPLWPLTGSDEMSVFQTLSAGNTGQPPTLGAASASTGARTTSATVAARAHRTARLSDPDRLQLLTPPT
jgi:hypothetical protein